ncbi:Nucleolus and neural progenitor protein [Collichthys lucidus]|uniref:Nucleolus and neural progenitor protein n=1 Tax=Collichthys lucidus TaxID=240159 RepID=A0A4U5U284_COLLU|nr:Nucleolus and neural progenitor protein [Collichthys lucidus]
MSCTLNRCSRAFLLAKQHMKLEEFLVLNMVITSMLSRLWVIFRGILVSLCSLYQQILMLLSEVAKAQPMPYLTDFSLPADMTQFLGLSDAILPRKQFTDIRKQKEKKPAVKVKNSRQKGNFKEDLGVAIERGANLDAHLKPFLKPLRDFTQSTPSTRKKTDGKQRFREQVRSASSFSDMATYLDEMIQWCQAHKMGKERGLLNFLRLKCQKMKCLEEEGYNMKRQLQVFRQEARWASSPRGSMPRTCQPSTALKRNAHLRTRFHSLRSQYKFLVARAGVQKKQPKRQKKRTKSSVSGAAQGNRTSYRGRSKTTCHDSCDDIDDIFATIGL